MARNRKKQSNPIQLGAFAPFVVILIILGVVGLSLVFYKNQLHATGRQIKSLEQELADLKTQNDVLRAKVTSLSSRNVLQRQLATGFIKMVPITSDRILRWNAAPPTLAMDSLRRVSNEGVLK
jgi:cell division protein FtsB